MAIPTDRAGYTHGGIRTEFRLNTDDSLLWEASMVFLPGKDDVVPYAVGATALADYTVVRVKFEFRKATQADGEGDPQEVATGLCFCVPVVIVKVGL